MKQANVIFVFADQWRAQATGYAGDPNVRTPNLDRLAGESINFRNAISCCPVCTPYRANLVTGQYPLTHGVFLNDVCPDTDAVSLADAFKAGGYDTGYIGKWHIDGHGRDNYIPPERRQGFDYWKVRECTHKYNESFYYDQDCDEKVYWDGYDAIAQTRDAQEYIRTHKDKPFLLVMSWGPPHAPYHTAPPEFQAMYDKDKIELAPNVPEHCAEEARRELAGYYSHCSALDMCMGELMNTLADEGMAEDTILVFSSDHGDMLFSHGDQKKQRPLNESVRIPFLLRYPAQLGKDGRSVDAFIDAPDVMPTLLGLAGLEVPETVEGKDFTGYLKGGDDPKDGEGFMACFSPFGQYSRQNGGREFRGVLTDDYTYAEGLDGPWLLFDNRNDPYQVNNLVDDEAHAQILAEMRERLKRKLDEMGDEFLPGSAYIDRWNYEVTDNGTVDYWQYGWVG